MQRCIARTAWAWMDKLIHGWRLRRLVQSAAVSAQHASQSIAASPAATTAFATASEPAGAC